MLHVAAEAASESCGSAGPVPVEATSAWKVGLTSSHGSAADEAVPCDVLPAGVPTDATVGGAAEPCCSVPGAGASCKGCCAEDGMVYPVVTTDAD